MQLTVQTHGDVHVARVQEGKLTYPVLAAFFAEIRRIVEAGARRLVIDLSGVTYIDSASIGCLMDIHRLLQEKKGSVRIAGLQPRVETMLSMTGVHKIVPVFRSSDEAVASFNAAGGSDA